jgi:hypothetical protein
MRRNFFSASNSPVAKLLSQVRESSVTGEISGTRVEHLLDRSLFRLCERQWPRYIDRNNTAHIHSPHALGKLARLEFRMSPRTNSVVRSREPVGPVPGRWRSDHRCTESGLLAHEGFARIFRRLQAGTRRVGSPQVLGLRIERNSMRPSVRYPAGLLAGCRDRGAAL